MSAPFGVDGFIHNCCVHAGAPWGGWVHSGGPCVSFGLCVVDGFNRLCPGVHWVHPGSLCSLPCAEVVIGFIGYILVRCVHSCAPMGSLGSSGVAGFTLVHSRCHPGWLGSLGCTLGVVGFIRVRTRVCPLGRWVHSGTLGSLGSALGVVGFFGFTVIRPGFR